MTPISVSQSIGANKGEFSIQTLEKHMKNQGDGDEQRGSIGILIGYNVGSGKNTGKNKIQ